MPTIACTLEEFNDAFCQFNEAIGYKSNSQEGIANMYKGLILHYLGLQDVSPEEMSTCSDLIQVATRGAIRRGWVLVNT